MTSRSATRAAYHACSYGRPVAVLVRVSFSLLWHLQAKLTQPHPPCGVERNPCQPCKSSLVIRQNRGDGVKLSLVPLVIRRSTEETTPNLHCDVHFGDEKSQTTSPRDTPAPLGRAGAFVVFASRHLLPSLAPSLADGRVLTAGGRVTRQARRGIKWEAYIDR